MAQKSPRNYANSDKKHGYDGSSAGETRFLCVLSLIPLWIWANSALDRMQTHAKFSNKNAIKYSK